MEGLTAAKANLVVYIHPSRANKVRHAIHRQLSSLLFTYDETFDGIMLAYKLLTYRRHANILPGLVPYFGVKLEAKLLIFSPRPDMLVEGKVVKLGKESIHVIILGFSSAAIMLDDIRDEFKYKIKDGVGVFASVMHRRHVIKTGSMIRFMVKSFDEEVLHISGSLGLSNTGCIRWLSKDGAEDTSHLDRGSKRTRQRNIKKELQEDSAMLINEANRSADPSYLHSSRKRTRYEG